MRSGLEPCLPAYEPPLLAQPVNTSVKTTACKTIFIETLTTNIKDELKSDDLNENEFKVGHSLVKILEEWRELFSQVNEGKNSPKFNKNLILLYIRNMTGLNTKEIRNSMKRFKSLYRIFKDNYLDS
jgi:hypothetical protein